MNSQLPMGEVWDNFSFYVRDNRTNEHGWLSIKDFLSEFGLEVIKSSKNNKEKTNEQTSRCNG